MLDSITYSDKVFSMSIPMFLASIFLALALGIGTALVFQFRTKHTDLLFSGHHCIYSSNTPEIPRQKKQHRHRSAPTGYIHFSVKKHQRVHVRPV